MRKPTAVDSNDANVNEALTDTAQAAEASVVKGGSQDEGDREDEVVHADVMDDRQPPEDLTISSDPGLWGDITEELVEMAISKGPQGRLILPQSTSAQRPSLVLQLFKLAVDGGPSFHVAQK
ncbi:unnamed protein product [Boreogadus saida]